jgi:hypothetical protein
LTRAWNVLGALPLSDLVRVPAELVTRYRPEATTTGGTSRIPEGPP